MFTVLLQTENYLLQCNRFRSGKVNLQRPRPPFYTRALVEAVTKPIYPRKTAIDVCHENRIKRNTLREQSIAAGLHPYEKILAKELFDHFDSAKMILICQKNSMDSFDYFNFRVALHKKNVKAKIYGRKIIKGAIADTKFNAMLPLLTQCPYNCMLFSNEWNVSDVLKVLKKTPKVLLLAGVLGDRYMSKNELEHFASLPDIGMVRAQFVATMESVGGQLTNHLQAHQSNLAYMLDAHAEALKSTTASTSTSTSDNSTNDSSTENKT